MFTTLALCCWSGAGVRIRSVFWAAREYFR